MLSRFFAFAGVLLALAGCGAATGDATSAQRIAKAARNASILATGLQTSVNLMADNPAIGMSEGTREKLQTALAGIRAASVALAETSSVDDARPLVLRLTEYANTIISTAAMIPGLPTPVSAGLAAASILLPVIQIAVGMAVEEPPAPVVEKAKTTLESPLAPAK